MNTPALLAYTTDSVISADGTTIGYRQLGHGPAVILVHGGMQASQNFMKLAEALSDAFTVYVLDRRGRGLSGPHGDHYCVQRECEDIDALLRKTGAHNVFALSAGALVSLQAALTLPAIQKVALYEPPLQMSEGPSLTTWVPRYERELAQGNLAAAMVTVMKGTEDTSFFASLPRFVLVPLLTLGAQDDAKEVKAGDVPIKDLIPTMHYDPMLVDEMAGRLETFRAMHAEVLLLGGSKSPKYLKTALDGLSKGLPKVRRVEFPGLDHLAADNGGKPEIVAAELRRFFAESPAKN